MALPLGKHLSRGRKPCVLSFGRAPLREISHAAPERGVLAASHGGIVSRSARDVAGTTAVERRVTRNGEVVSNAYVYRVYTEKVRNEIYIAPRSGAGARVYQTRYGSIHADTSVAVSTDGVDTYDFAGEVVDVQVTEQVPIYVNGTRIE